MTDHPTLEPTTAAVRIRAGEASGAAAAPSAFADLVCADHELLHAEFDAIIAANFPGAAERGHRLGPDTTVVAVTERVSEHRCPAPSDRRPGRGRAGGVQGLRARQRAPPPDHLGPAVRDPAVPR